MGYEILRDEELESLLRKVFRENPVLRSQAALSRALASELDGRGARASGSRLRRIAMEKGLARLEIIYRHTQRETGGDCPVCSAPMEEMVNSTLEGGEAVIGHRCRGCEFKVVLERREPGRYVFHARKG